MQSQLQAALLGHGVNTNVSLTTEDEEKDEQDDEGEDVDEFIEEELDSESGVRVGKQNVGNTSTCGRTITLQMLLSAGILQPGNGTMTIEYLGQKFVGDLLDDGKIRSQETDIVFASPSAWAIACKRFINPDKKSGCGWASVKYKGRKLDAYKNIWYKKKKEEEQKLDKEEENSYCHTEKKSFSDEIDGEMFELSKIMAASIPQSRIIVKHNTIANRTFTHDANTLIECVPFSNLGKIQPFLVSISTNAALVMDFHCHLTKSEVCGYLGGHWDVNGHNLQITHAFPCRNSKAERENAPQVEAEISKAIDKEQLILVGWYHSHPFCAAAPTLRDIDAQLDYQIRMKGTSDNSYTPCVGIIVSPYNYENASLESNIVAYWVIPPPEAKPNEYGRPMLMSYSVVQDSILPSGMSDEMKKCADYYKKAKDFICFLDKYNSATTYIEKLKTTLSSKFPRDQSETTLWSFIRDLVGCSITDKESPISIPTVNKASQILSNLSSSVGLSQNLMLNSDIASMLFNTSKFPNPNTLLGIPDPMAQSTLAANSMFFSPNLFKMQDLLKPLSTSSPLPSKTKSDIKSTPLKIPSGTEIKMPKYELPTDLNIMPYKNKSDYSGSELNLSKSSSKTDFSTPDISISNIKTPKVEFSVADLSISSVRSQKLEYSSMNLSKDSSELHEPPPVKVSKTDYSSLDLSLSSNKTLAETLENVPNDLSITRSEEFSSVNISNDNGASSTEGHE